jgi:hypothetical protein
LRIAFYCNLMGWPKRSGGGVAPVGADHGQLARCAGLRRRRALEAPKSKFIDEPQLDPRVGRVLLGYRIISRFRLDAYVRAHPGVRVVAALNEFNIRAAKLKQRVGDRPT